MSSAMRPISPLPSVPQTRIGVLSAVPSTHENRPTAIATRYVDIFGVVENRTTCLAPPDAGVSEMTRPFEIALSRASIVSEMSKVALNAGSSKPGKARRASVASSCVTAYRRFSVLLRYRPRS